MKYYTSFRPGSYWDYAKRAVEAGIEGFEIYQSASYLPAEEYEAYLEQVQRIKEELSVHFTVHAPFLDINLGSLNKKIRDAAIKEMQASLDLGRKVGASVVTIHCGTGILTMPEGKWSKQVFEPTGENRELVARQEQLLVRAVKDLADYAPDILLGIENLVFPHEMYRSPEDMQELLTKINRSNVGLTLDAGHALVSGYQASEYINLLNDRIVHVHLHDNHGIRDEHLPLGQGIVDYVGIIQSLKQGGYQGVVTLEFSLGNPANYADYLLEFR